MPLRMFEWLKHCSFSKENAYRLLIEYKGPYYEMPCMLGDKYCFGDGDINAQCQVINTSVIGNYYFSDR